MEWNWFFHLESKEGRYILGEILLRGTDGSANERRIFPWHAILNPVEHLLHFSKRNLFNNENLGVITSVKK